MYTEHGEKVIAKQTKTCNGMYKPARSILDCNIPEFANSNIAARAITSSVHVCVIAGQWMHAHRKSNGFVMHVELHAQAETTSDVFVEAILTQHK
jgi:hypothetical protein